MAHRAELERKPKHLGLAAGEIALRIDAGDSERRRRRRRGLYSLGRRRRIHRSVGEPVIEDRPDRGDRIAPADLLALSIGAPRVRDWHLIDTPSGARRLGGYLGLKSEAVGVEL